MKLQDLLRGLPIINAFEYPIDNFEVSKIDFDSRAVQSGSLFVAVPGNQSDGHKYIPQAIAGGARILIVQKDYVNPNQVAQWQKSLPHALPIVVVEDSRRALDFLASQFYHRPGDHLLCVGITGTNGKTSLTYMLEHFFSALQQPTGVIGTIDHHLLPPDGKQKKTWPSEGTTPNPVLLQQRLRDFLDLGASVVVMEVTSHALAQHRVESVPFDIAVFLNLTQDHLDYHLEMESYFESKVRLFTELLRSSPKPKTAAVINISDEWGARLCKRLSGPLVTFGKEKGDFHYQIKSMEASQTSFDLQTPEGLFHLQSPLCGEFNVQNIVASLATVFAAGLNLRVAMAALPSFAGVPGRLQRVQTPENHPIFVDYAHTPDGLENVLRSLVEVRSQSPRTSAKIWTIFGCGGDRDAGKRPLMAQIAEKYADEIMVTSDNPRTEVPEKILKEIEAGFAKSTRFFHEVDRRKAIETVLRKAHPLDLVLIAGKGHEDYQIMGTQKLPFSDFAIVEDFFKKKRESP